MHLVYKALEKYAIPNVLPPELMPPGKRKDSVPPGPIIPVSAVPVANVPVAQTNEISKVLNGYFINFILFIYNYQVSCSLL